MLTSLRGASHACAELFNLRVVAEVDEGTGSDAALARSWQADPIELVEMVIGGDGDVADNVELAEVTEVF